MSRNVEIKARIASVEALLPTVKAVAGQGPKESFYLRSPTTAPEVLREALTLAYGQTGRVEKHRTLFLAGRTRIHLDRVTGLGHFLELEVVLEEDESPEVGVREANELLRRLGVDRSQLIEGGYFDLLRGDLSGGRRKA